MCELWCIGWLTPIITRPKKSSGETRIYLSGRVNDDVRQLTLISLVDYASAWLFMASIKLLKGSSGSILPGPDKK